jgi:hypothetical protein
MGKESREWSRKRQENYKKWGNFLHTFLRGFPIAVRIFVWIFFLLRLCLSLGRKGFRDGVEDVELRNINIISYPFTPNGSVIGKMKVTILSAFVALVSFTLSSA